MGLFDKKWLAKQPEPEPMIYFVLKENGDLEQIEKDCVQSGLDYAVEKRAEGETWFYFYEKDREAAYEIMNHPREKMAVPKVSLNAQITAAQNKPQVPDNRRAEPMVEDSTAERSSVPAQIEQPADSSASSTNIENRWARERAIKELKEIQEKSDAAALPTASCEPDVEPNGRQRKKRKSIGRVNQIKTRLTDAELVQFQRRVKKSGLAQGEFLRNAALTGQIVIEEHSIADVAMLDELAMIRAELGRQGGLLKMIIKPNEGQRKLAPEEWSKLIGAIRDMEATKKRLSELEVKVQHGNREAQDK